jgi:hypothetical protein
MFPCVALRSLYSVCADVLCALWLCWQSLLSSLDAWINRPAADDYIIDFASSKKYFFLLLRAFG